MLRLRGRCCALTLISSVPPASTDNDVSPVGNPEDWTVSQVSDWLRAINLDQYIASFTEAKIDGTCLVVGLDDDSLQELNVSMKIHRKKIENELKKLFPS
jgi:hypothetical protein